ncbi:MAG: hypothetical protein Q9P01_17880 [Anaerolineae bacterium]|nr:hypothetical protein [Anaerolineae bacterium]MDQ7036625.1 hypothetical protein [Anaerolineae bacterium]
MTTWQLWHLLRYPLRQNEVFRWLWRDGKSRRTSTKSQTSVPLRILLVIFGMSVILALIPLALVVTLLSLLTLPLLILIFNGTVLGVYGISSITVTLAHHLHSRRSELIATTPRSRLGIAWIMATVCIHRGDTLRTAYRLVRWVVGIVTALLVVGLIFIMATLPDSALRAGQVTLLLDLLGLMGFAIIAWLDHIQSIVLAALVSILAPTYSTERPLIQVAAISVYITLQMIFYAIMIVFFRLFQAISQNLFTSPITQRWVVIVLILIAFYSLREWLIIGLYRLILQRYEVPNSEFQNFVS